MHPFKIVYTIFATESQQFYARLMVGLVKQEPDTNQPFSRELYSRRELWKQRSRATAG